MPVETSTTLAGLDDTYPLGGDPKSQGDDHLRLIKSVLKAQFPGVNGDGYNIPITATEAELNGLHGFTNVGFATGTRMPFAQAAAPTGWVKDASDSANNRMLRVVTGTGGGIGGTNSPILNNTSIPAHTHTFTGSAMASHNHTQSAHQHVTSTAPDENVSSRYYFGNAGGSGSYKNTTGSVASAARAYTSSVTAVNVATSAGTPSGTNNTNAAVSWAPRYIDMIICTKS